MSPIIVLAMIRSDVDVKFDLKLNNIAHKAESKAGVLVQAFLS